MGFEFDNDIIIVCKNTLQHSDSKELKEILSSNLSRSIAINNNTTNEDNCDCILYIGNEDSGYHHVLEHGETALIINSNFIKAEHPFEVVGFDYIKEEHENKRLERSDYFKGLFEELKKLNIESVFISDSCSSISTDKNNSWEDIYSSITRLNKYVEINLS